MRELDEVFAALSKSAFRCKFHLQGKDIAYLHTKGLSTVIEHAKDFIGKRLTPATLANDGKQTPFRGAPGFCCTARDSLLLPGLFGKMAQNTQGTYPDLRRGSLYYQCPWKMA